MQIQTGVLRGAMAASLLFAVAACEDDGKTDAGDNDGGAGDDGGAGMGDDDGGGDNNGDDGGESNPDPVYALVTQVFGASGDENVSYVLLGDSLDNDFDVEEAELSVPGRAIGFGPDEGGQLFLGGDEPLETGGSAATIARYDLQDDGSLEKFDEQVSFAGKGVSEIGEYPGNFYFASATRAYYFDGSNAQVIIWNPEEMKIVDDEPLDDLVLEGNGLSFSARPVVVDDQVFTFAGWRSMTDIPSQAAVVAVDTETDEVSVVTADRCGYVRDGVLADDGYIYMATENYGSAVHRINEGNAPTPCLIRFDPEAGEFDEDFFVELNELFDGDTAGGLVAGPDGSAFVGVLDESVAVVDDMSHPRVLASEAGAWQWASLTLGDDPEGELLSVDPGNGSVVPQVLGGDIYVPQFMGRDESDLRKVTSEGPRNKLVGNTSGLVFSAIRLR